jgi:hypothetical protein
MRKRRIGWPKVMGSMLRLGMSAGAVVGLRLAKLGKGGAAARRESARMVEEKLRAAFDANAEAARTIVSGKAHRAPERVLALYQRRVAANLRRLAKKP